MLIVNQYKVIPIKDKNKKAQLDSLELNCSKVPYIRINRDAPTRDPYTGFRYAGAPIPQSIEGKDFKEIKIEIGYFDVETLALQPDEIKIENVFVEEINYWEYTNAEEGKGHCYKFHLRGEDGGKFIYEHDGSIKTFLGTILKKINKEIESGISFSEINIHFFKECSLDWEWDIHHKYFNPYNSILSMVYNSKLERKETFHSPYGSNYGITIDLESPYMYNPYVFWLFSKSIKDLKFVTKGKNRKYTGLVMSLPKYIEEELGLGDVIHPDYKNHVELDILSNIVLNYNEDFCRQAWKKLTPTWESNKYITPKISSELYNQYCIFRNMKCWHYIDGQYRVGRDDYEWDEDTYAIPVLGGCKISEKVLDAINRELKINFQYQEESQRYYFRVCGESETIAGMAKRRGGEISNENTISQILKIMLAEGV